MHYFCSCCGQIHEGMPDVVFDRPLQAQAIPEAECAARLRLDADLCVIDEEYYFIRGVIELPIHGLEETFGIGAWLSLKPKNFRIYAENMTDSNIGPFFGWLSNEIPLAAESTINLKARAHFRGGDLRPSIELEPTDHPLAVAQREGISLDEAWRFIHRYIEPPAANTPS